MRLMQISEQSPRLLEKTMKRYKERFVNIFDVYFVLTIAKTDVERWKRSSFDEQTRALTHSKDGIAVFFC